jgi:small subunit ribosomal protein S21
LCIAISFGFRLKLSDYAFRELPNPSHLVAALFFFALQNGGLKPFCRFDTGVKFFMQIMVRDNNVDQALRALKKKLQREGVYREMKLRRHFEKPSEKRAREKAAAVRRARKMERKQQERDGAKA